MRAWLSGPFILQKSTFYTMFLLKELVTETRIQKFLVTRSRRLLIKFNKNKNKYFHSSFNYNYPFIFPVNSKRFWPLCVWQDLVDMFKMSSYKCIPCRQLPICETNHWLAEAVIFEQITNPIKNLRGSVPLNVKTFCKTTYSNNFAIFLTEQNVRIIIQ
jgi:hypothetical protein